LGIGDWGLGIWGWGVGAQTPTPKPHPQPPKIFFKKIFIKKNKKNNL